MIWSITSPINGCQPYQSVQSSIILSTEEEPIQLFPYQQVLFWSTNSDFIRHMNTFLNIFTRIYTSIQFYTAISTVRNFFLWSGLYSNHDQNNFWSRYSQLLFVERWNFSNIYLIAFNWFIIIKNVIISFNLLLYHFIQSFLFLNWSRLITGFTIKIYQRKTKAVFFQHESFYAFITNYFVRHIHFYPDQSYKNKNWSRIETILKYRNISFSQSNMQQYYYHFSSNEVNHRKITSRPASIKYHL